MPREDPCLQRLAKPNGGRWHFCLGKNDGRGGNPPLLPPLHKGGFVTPDRRGRRPRRPASPSCQSTEPFSPLVIPTEPLFPLVIPTERSERRDMGTDLLVHEISPLGRCRFLGRNDIRAFLPPPLRSNGQRCERPQCGMQRVELRPKQRAGGAISDALRLCFGLDGGCRREATGEGEHRLGCSRGGGTGSWQPVTKGASIVKFSGRRKNFSLLCCHICRSGIVYDCDRFAQHLCIR